MKTPECPVTCTRVVAASDNAVQMTGKVEPKMHKVPDNAIIRIETEDEFLKAVFVHTGRSDMMTSEQAKPTVEWEGTLEPGVEHRLRIAFDEQTAKGTVPRTGAAISVKRAYSQHEAEESEEDSESRFCWTAEREWIQWPLSTAAVERAKKARASEEEHLNRQKKLWSTVAISEVRTEAEEKASVFQVANLKSQLVWAGMRLVARAMFQAVEELVEEQGVNPLSKGKPLGRTYIMPSHNENVSELLFRIARLAMMKHGVEIPADAGAFCRLTAITGRHKVTFHQERFNSHSDVNEMVIIQLRGNLKVTTKADKKSKIAVTTEIDEGELMIVPAKKIVQYQRTTANGNATAVVGFVQKGSTDPYGLLWDPEQAQAEALPKGHSILEELVKETDFQ
jgi:hypothetical protein